MQFYSNGHTIDSIGGGALEIDLDELRRYYAGLSDEGILDIKREDLTELARQYYDAEVKSRGLVRESPSPDGGTTTEAEALVVAQTFLSPNEAWVGRDVLRSAGISAYLEQELDTVWPGGNRSLMVPRSYLEEAEEILASITPLSDEELAAQAEAAEPVDGLEIEEPDDSVQERPDR